MRVIDTAAICVGQRRLSGADRLLVLVTPDHGRVHAVARANCLPSSPIGAALAPFGSARVVLHPGRGWYRLEAADRVVTWHHIGADLKRMQGAGLVCAWARAMAREEDAGPLYRLVHETLTALDRSAEQVAAIIARFLWRLVTISGIAPNLGSCVECQRDPALVAFRSHPGGGVCTTCRQQGDPVLPAPSWSALEAFQAAKSPAWRAVPESVARPLAGLAQGYLRRHFGMELPGRVNRP